MNILSVTQLNNYVKMCFENRPELNHFYVSGEISKITFQPSSGHAYFTLKDENNSVDAVMFKWDLSKIKFRPSTGMKVLCNASANIYVKTGRFQISVHDMQPDGIGALSIAYEQLKKKLETEGLFSEARKQPIPSFPHKVGVITAPKGAAVRDILNVLSRRFPLAEVVFYPTLVQGEKAAGELANAVKTMNEHSAADVIIIGRGGGSVEDLWAFNDETLARTIAASKIPVISAVGHETDFTICDFVSDLRAPTPSAAAELAVPNFPSLLDNLAKFDQRMLSAYRFYLENKRNYIHILESKPCLQNPINFVEQQSLRVDLATQRLINKFSNEFTSIENHFQTVISKLDALSPLKVLARGYAIPSKEGKVITGKDEIERNDLIELQLVDGKIQCQVKEKI